MTPNLSRIAEQAEAELASGAIAGQEVDEAYLDGVRDALRYALDGTLSSGLSDLLGRAEADEDDLDRCSTGCVCTPEELAEQEL